MSEKTKELKKGVAKGPTDGGQRRCGRINGLKELFSQFNITAERLEETYRILQEKVEQAGISAGFGPLIGKDKRMRDIYEIIRAVAKSKAPVLISGESGTGKELVARAIHQESDRRDKLFVSINCAALPEGLLESELFGHEKGSFTGAIEKRKGKFELANHGTLLLDEISEMSLSLQAKLLRVLQEFKFFRVGGDSEVDVDVRVVATTNKDPKVAVAEGRFREDLFYRLNVVPIIVPPLRERKGDIPLLSAYFLKKYSTYYGKAVNSISSDALKVLLSYDWPGNVRELENVIERAVILNSSKSIEASHLDMQIASKTCSYNDNRAQDLRVDNLLGLPLREVEKRVILATLDKVGGNRKKAAEVLGINVKTLRSKLKDE